MKEYLAVLLTFLLGTVTAREVHLVPAHKVCPNVTGPEDILIPDPNDCSVYYRCENGAAVPQSCPPNLHWCQILQECTLPVFANCILSNTVVTYPPQDLATYTPKGNPATGPPGTEGTGPPVTGPSGTGPPGTSPPTIGPPGTETPGTGPPGTQTPGSGPPGTGPPGTGPPGTHTPGTETPGTGPPGTGPPVTHTPGTGPPGTGPSGTGPPGTSPPTIGPPGTETPGTETPGTGPPGTQTPGTGPPGTGPPGTGLPGTGPPGTHTPGTETPGTGPPGTGPPVTHTPGTGPPGTQTPGTETPGTFPPGTGPPGTQTPGTGPPGTGESITTSVSGTIEPTTTQSKPPSIFCPQPDLLYPSFTECNQYQKCDNNRQLVSVTCDPPTFNYNCHTKKCENITHCCVPNNPTTNTTLTPPTTAPTPSPSEDLCPSDGALLPNPVDCTGYFVCRNNTPVPQQCPEGQEYSCWDQTCENPQDATCITNIQQNDTCSKNDIQQSNIADCSSYYECVDGKVELQSCPDGESYNKWFEKCMARDLAHCKTYPSQENSTSTTVSPGTNNICPLDGALLPNPLNCSTYFVCIDENPTLASCPEGEIYSCWDQQCEPPTIGECVTNTQAGDSCSIDNLHLPKIQDCSSYYKCENGSIVVEKCPGDLEYNSWFKKCVDSDVSHCKPSTVPTTVSTTTERHTTVTPSPVNDICPSDGATLPNPIDCHSYFLCVNGTPENKQCPNGEEYSCWDQKCEKPEDSVCINDGSQGGKNCSKNGDKLTNVADCGSYFECVNGTIELQQCSNGTFYSKWFESCMEDTLAHCKTYPTQKPSFTEQPTPTTISPSSSQDLCPFEGALLPNPLNCSTYFTCVNHEPTLESCPNGQGYSCWDQQCEESALEECNPNNNLGHGCSIENLALPNSKDCSSYLECQNYTVETQECPEGQEYNSWFQKCGAPDLSHCPYKNSSNPTTPTAPEVTGLTTPQPGFCPTDGAKLPNPLNCSSYYICLSGKIVTKHCPTGMIYSCWDQECQSPSDGTCINQGNQEGKNCSVEGLVLPNIADCGGFYTCINGQVVFQACATGSIFSESLEVCVSLEIDSCVTYPTVSPPSVTPPSLPDTPSPTNNICPLDGALIPNPIDCASYYKCVNGTPQPEKCPGGEEYNCWDQQCEPDTTATCVNQGTPNGNNCSIEGIKIVDVSDCSQYYECVNGIIILKTCPDGQEFNAAFQGCYKPDLAHCKTAPTGTTPQETTGGPSPTPSGEDLCPTDGALLPNPLNCSAYYKCINGTPTPQLCAEGYEYSCWDEQCEPAAEAVCITEGGQANITCKYNGQRIQNPEDCHTYYQCVNGKTVLKKCIFNWFYNKWFHICTPIKLFSHCSPITIPTPTPRPSTTNTPAPTNKDTCPIDGALLPDQLDCSGYYKCENNNPVHQTCPSGQVYSCWDQQCEDNSTAQCITSGVEPDQNCSRDGVKLPNPNDCSSYYECAGGKIQPRYCFIGFQYNQWYQKCVLFFLSHCKAVPTKPTTSTTPEPTLSTPSGQYDLCPEDGVKIPNAIDCTKYYLCVNHTPTIESCPEGEMYSCWDQKCEQDKDATCIAQPQVGVSCTIEGLKLAKVDNCSSYYECINGTVVEEQCADGLEFNSKFGECYQPELSHCHTHPTIAPVTGTNKPPTVQPDKDLCPVDGALLPNPLNCSTYFKCINQVPVEQQCADGYEYSCWDMQCEPKGEAQCINQGVPDNKQCSKNNQKYPDPDDCQQYFVCVNHEITTKKCPFNLYYNRWFKMCVFKNLAHCNETSTVEPDVTTVTTPKPSKQDNCPVNGQKIPDPTDCSKYLQCVKNKSVKKSCPKGQKYSAWDQQCKDQSEVKCYNVGSPDGQNCSRDGVTLQNLESCTTYFKCNNGKVEEQFCFIGTKYNRWYQECQIDLFSHCKTYSTIAAPTTTTQSSPVTTVKYPKSSCTQDGAKVPDSKNSNKYFVCEDKSLVEYNCQPGTNYDVWSEDCISNASTLSDIKEGEKCSKKKQKVPDPKSCSNYYECDGKKVHKKKCGLLKKYNIWTQKCDFSILAICLDGIFGSS